MTLDGGESATITDMKVGDAVINRRRSHLGYMLEQGSRVMSAVHKRLHYAMRLEFKLLANVMSEFLPDSYPYTIAGVDSSVKSEDFDERVDVLPVSNPNIFRKLKG